MKRSIVFALVITLLAACSTKEFGIQTPLQDDIIYYASFEQPAEYGTRVYANEDLHLRWTADDRVSIFGKNTYNQQYKFLGETGDNSGGFSKVEGAEYVTGNPISHTVSVYPYQASTMITEDEVLMVTLPAEQHYAENTFGLGSNTMISVSEDNVLMYKNVGGYLRISLYGEGVSVSSITLKGNNGEKLAGKASVTMPLDGVPSVTLADNAKTEIILSCDTPVQLGSTEEESIHFWFVVPPVFFEKGFTVSILEDKAGIFEKKTSNSIIIERNNLSKMSAIMVDKVPLPVPEAIDLGLSVKWADMNLGALSPSDDGDWYAWGETETKDYYDWDNYKWCNGPSTTSTNHYLTKYNSDSNYGVVDYKTVLEPEDDAAFVKLGSNWRMPTREEFVELSQNCDWEQTTLNGVTGYLVKSRVNSNSIFLYYSDEPLVNNLPLPSDVIIEGNYWSASVYGNPPSSAYRLMIRPDGIFPSAYARRCHGRNIRPVYDDGDTPTNLPEAIDLGLSVKWASFNLGASKPEEYGDYYAWGETDPKSVYNSSTYKWGTSLYSMTKYNSNDKKVILERGEQEGETMDDAARFICGGGWRMATFDEWSELMDTNNCSWTWINENGINGYLVTSKKIGFTDKSIFLPAAGNKDGSECVHDNQAGSYWSSSVSTERYYDANAVSFYDGYVDWGIFYRYYGFSIRPVNAE